jgi:hypothetical protein
MKFRLPRIRNLVSTPTKLIKVLGITVLAMVAMSGPVYATSAVLIPYLTIIQQVITDQLAKTVSDGFKKTTENLIKSQVEQYTKEITGRMMPGAYCEADVIKPIAVGGVARSTGYERAKSAVILTGADTLVNGHAAINARTGLPSNNPNVVITQHNREVRSLIANSATKKSNTCSPVQAIPVDSTGAKINCSDVERFSSATVLMGVAPTPELPDAANAGATGEVYEAARTTSIARKQLALLALSDVSSKDKDQFIAAYRELLGKAPVDEMNQLTASGAVQRDAIVLQRLTAHLLLESYVESLETKRLIATIVAQQTEVDDREVLAALRRRK